MKNFVQTGGVISFIAAAAIVSGQVVPVGQLLAVAAADYAPGEMAEGSITGVFLVPKVSGAVIKAGESLTWDVSAGAFDDNLAVPGVGDITGACAVAFEDAGNGVTELKVRFTGVPGTVKAA